MAWSPGEAAGFAAEAGFPVIAKLAAPWRQAAASRGPARRGGRGCAAPRSCARPADLDALYHRCAEAGLGLMLQEYIPAAPGQDWFFHGYCDAGSRPLAAFTGVKDRSYPAHAGLTSLGRAVPNRGLTGQVTGLLQRVGFRGLADLDLRRDPRDGEYKLLDFNPRLGAQFRLFADPAGIDVARAAYLDLTGQPAAAGQVTPGPPLPGRELRPARRDRLLARGRARAGGLGGLGARGRRDRLVRPGRPGAVRADVPADELAGGQPRRWTRGPSVPPRAAGGSRYSPGPRAVAAAGMTRTPRNSPEGGGEGMSSTTDVAIVGAGPYGLSVAAHLRRSGLSGPAVRAADAPVAREHAAGHVPQVAGVRLQPVRPGGGLHPGRVLPRDRPALRRLRPARAAGRTSWPTASGSSGRRAWTWPRCW